MRRIQPLTNRRTRVSPLGQQVSPGLQDLLGTLLGNVPRPAEQRLVVIWTQTREKADISIILSKTADSCSDAVRTGQMVCVSVSSYESSQSRLFRRAQYKKFLDYALRLHHNTKIKTAPATSGHRRSCGAACDLWSLNLVLPHRAASGFESPERQPSEGGDDRGPYLITAAFIWTQKPTNLKRDGPNES